MTHISCATLDGAKGVKIDVEASLIKGLPAFTIVGLADLGIAESRERTKAALSKSNISLPPYKLIINLSPADIRKSGSFFDLSIALGAMCEILKKEPLLKNIIVLGELGLDGALKHTPQIFPIALSMLKEGLADTFLVPSKSAYFLQKIPNIKVYGADTLTGAFDTLTTGDAECKHGTQNISGESLTLDGKEFFYTREFAHDFSDVKGQNIAKRAALIAAAGMHNILMEGSPGCGKSMIAKRLRYILPPMSVDEILKFAMLDFLEGKESDFSAKRPFRSPHNNSTRSALLGGGSKEGQIGEVALSSGGILWLDELPHFDKTLIEGLREPLENYRILISRVNSKIDYDADFMFVGSMNPCPCGNLLSKTKECRCKESEIQRYKNRLSEPFLDRMDIFVQMEEFSEAGKSDITSNEMFDNVIKAFSAQMKRGGKLNSRLSDKELAGLEITDEATDMLQKAGARFAMSARSSAKTLKVARTIADLENSIKVEKPHILEALSYRKRG